MLHNLRGGQITIWHLLMLLHAVLFAVWGESQHISIL